MFMASELFAGGPIQTKSAVVPGCVPLIRELEPFKPKKLKEMAGRRRTQKVYMKKMKDKQKKRDCRVTERCE